MSPAKRLALTLALMAPLAAALIALSQEPARAYASIRLPGAESATATGRLVRWDLSNANGRPNIANGRIRYVMGDSGTRFHASLSGPYDEFQAVQKSFNVWRDIRRSAVDFEFAGTTATPARNGQDQINTVYWASTGIAPGVFAETVTTYDTTTGEIVDADLIFNDGVSGGNGFVWNTIGLDATLGVNGDTYVENIAVHEIGHFLGIDHAVISSSTLYPFSRQGTIALMTPETDDIAPIVASHPDTRLPSEAHASVSGVVRAGGVGRLGVSVMLIDLAPGLPVIGALSDRETTTSEAGEFIIEDVPPGAYYVYATPTQTGIYGTYYSQPFTSFLPTIFGVQSGSMGVPAVLRVRSGDALTGVNISVADATDLFEPNDAFGDATPLTVGHALGARLEIAGDVDYYRINLANGERLTARVIADSFSSQLNPLLVLYSFDGTTKLISGDFADNGTSVYSQAARDLQSSDYLPEAHNADAELSFTATRDGFVYLAVVGTGGQQATSGSAGPYILTTRSDRSMTALDQTQTELSTSILGGSPTGADFTLAVTPRNAAAEALPDARNFYMAIVDISDGSSVVDSRTGTGPWSFTVSRPGVAGEKVYGVRIGSSSADAVLMDQQARVSFAGGVDANESSVFIIATSMVRDGEDESPIEIYLRDAAGLAIVDSMHSVSLQTTGGAVSTPTFDTESGVWRATLTAPSSGTSIQVTAIADGVTIGSASVSLLSMAASEGLPVPDTPKKKDEGGCAISADGLGDAHSTWLLLLACALLLAIGMRARPRRN